MGHVLYEFLYMETRTCTYQILTPQHVRVPTSGFASSQFSSCTSAPWYYWNRPSLCAAGPVFQHSLRRWLQLCYAATVRNYMELCCNYSYLHMVCCPPKYSASGIRGTRLDEGYIETRRAYVVRSYRTGNSPCMGL